MLWTTSISYINGMNLIVFLFLLSSFSYDHTCHSHMLILAMLLSNHLDVELMTEQLILSGSSFVGITASLHFKAIMLN